MKFFVFAAVLLVTASCNLQNKESFRDASKTYNDSVTVMLDSLYRIAIPVAPLYDRGRFDSSAVAEYVELAQATQGEVKLLVNAGLVSSEIARIVQTYASDGADLLLLIDKTQSMQDDIDSVKAGLGQIIDALKQYRRLRLGIALYGDKHADSTAWFSFQNFETQYDAAKTFVDSVRVTGGGDWPESVYDGFFKASGEGFWKSGNKRMVILVGDAPPLPPPLSDYTVADVIKKATAESIRMNFYPLVVSPVYGEFGLSGKTLTPTYKQARLCTNLYPNPSSGTVHVQFEVPGPYAIELFNAAGAAVYSEQFSGSRWSKDLNGLPNGAYVLRAVNKAKEFETVKFILYK